LQPVKLNKQLEVSPSSQTLLMQYKSSLRHLILVVIKIKTEKTLIIQRA